MIEYSKLTIIGWSYFHKESYFVVELIQIIYIYIYIYSTQ